MSKKRRSRSERKKAKQQALARQKSEFSTKNGRYEYIKSLGLTSLTRRFKEGKGKKRHTSKKTGEDIQLIHTDRTLHNYAGSWSRFSLFVAENISEKEMELIESLDKPENYIKLVNQYLNYCMKIGLSSSTQSTYKAALAKVLGVSSTNFIPTVPRYRAHKTNNRLKNVDSRLSKKNNDYWYKIVTATGLRKRELQSVTGDALIKRDDGQFYLHIVGKKHKSKGHRDRWIPVLARNENELKEIVSMFQLAGRKRVFNVPSALKPHKYRAEYACRLYRKVARDPRKIINQCEIVKLRKELTGIWLDRKACKIVSRALGHSRADEFQKSYAYKLWD